MFASTTKLQKIWRRTATQLWAICRIANNFSHSSLPPIQKTKQQQHTTPSLTLPSFLPLVFDLVFVLCVCVVCCVPSFHPASSLATCFALHACRFLCDLCCSLSYFEHARQFLVSPESACPPPLYHLFFLSFFLFIPFLLFVARGMSTHEQPNARDTTQPLTKTLPSTNPHTPAGIGNTVGTESPAAQHPQAHHHEAQIASATAGTADNTAGHVHPVPDANSRDSSMHSAPALPSTSSTARSSSSSSPAHTQSEPHKGTAGTHQPTSTSSSSAAVPPSPQRLLAQSGKFSQESQAEQCKAHVCLC